jgi:hypothetical protein
MSDERLKNLLRSTFPELDSPKPARDLWPAVMDRIKAPAAWSWIDISVAAGVGTGVAIALVTLPKALLLLVYHL